MPVAKGGPAPGRQAILVGLGALMTLGTILFLVTQSGSLFGGGSSTGVEAGDPFYRPGKAADLAEFIQTNGKPVALQDPVGGDRDIWLNHVGTDDATGWFAFGARPLTAPRQCSAQWDAVEQLFADSCNDTKYPPDGTGLPQFPVTVDSSGQVSIRLSTAPTTTATTSPDPSSTVISSPTT